MKKWNKEWIENNRERYNATKWIYADRIKQEVLLHYGNGEILCKNCGCIDIDILTLDHINDDGASQRREWNKEGSKASGLRQYVELKRRGYPAGIQILCFNCNWKKEMDRRYKQRKENKFYAGYYDSLSVQTERLARKPLDESSTV